MRIARALAARGIVAASIDYRLLGQAPRPSRRVGPLLPALLAALLSAAIAAAVDDTLTATDYLRAHARGLGIDIRRLGLVGSSAGAITADQVAYVLDDHGIRGPRLRFAASLWGGLIVARRRDGAGSRRSSSSAGSPPCSPCPATPIRRSRSRSTTSFTRRVVGRQTSFDRLLMFARTALR